MSFHNQIANILPLIGQRTDSVEPIKRGNDVFRLVSGTNRYFLKTYTKDWYGSDLEGTGFCAIHESAAWAILAKHSLSVPIVEYVATDCENPIARPFLLTRELEGRPLTSWLQEVNRDERSALLATVGAYLKQMHKITFEFPGYLSTISGPSEPPNPTGWQHRCWSAKAREEWTYNQLQTAADQLTETTYAEAKQACSNISTHLANAYQPPQFTHGDCHAHQFFLVRNEESWHVTGVLDMEVTSSGDCIEDLIKIGIELAQSLDDTTRWWEALFWGYGDAPDLEGFRLRLLGVAPQEYGVPGEWIRTQSREAMLQRLLRTREWSNLFEPIV